MRTRRKIIILIPSFTCAGPIKGAIALANNLAQHRKVVLISIKKGDELLNTINSDVGIIHLDNEHRSLLGKLLSFRKLVKSYGGRKDIVCLSMCFSADLFNLLCFPYAKRCSSIRGNLLKNYRLDYGLMGIVLAVIHLSMTRFFDGVIVMSNPMASQVKPYAGCVPKVIGNFIDEYQIERYRQKRKENVRRKIVFLGSLTERKQPVLLIKAVRTLLDKGYDIQLDIAGKGPLSPTIEKLIAEKSLTQKVVLHGHLDSPYELLAEADLMVLPSLSEGISRAAMEAMYLGTPCVMRAVDGNTGFIQHGRNGFLFDHDGDLVDILELALRKAVKGSGNLLLSGFRQGEECRRLLKYLESRQS